MVGLVGSVWLVRFGWFGLVSSVWLVRLVRLVRFGWFGQDPTVYGEPRICFAKFVSEVFLFSRLFDILGYISPT